MTPLLASFFKDGEHVIPSYLPDEAFFRDLPQIETGIVFVGEILVHLRERWRGWW